MEPSDDRQQELTVIPHYRQCREAGAAFIISPNSPNRVSKYHCAAPTDGTKQLATNPDPNTSLPTPPKAKAKPRIHYSLPTLIQWTGSTISRTSPYQVLVLSDSILEGQPHLEMLAKRVIAGRALKRHGHPADLIGAMLFLGSSESDFFAGQTVAVDGGSINT